MFVIVLFINLKKTNYKQVDLEFHYQPREFFAQAKLLRKSGIACSVARMVSN